MFETRQVPRNTPRDAASCILDNMEARKKQTLTLDGTVQRVAVARYGGDAGCLSLMVQTENKSSKNITFDIIYDAKSRASLKNELSKSIFKNGFPNPNQKIRHKAYSDAHHGPGSAAKKDGPMPPEAEVDLYFYWEKSATSVPTHKKLGN
ncbi:hypothetical protein N431DRAFT_448443 [Stipitochalara longipes BDJ]|nr:hypothetical protein N431DRAFT_448443 [Stipitochalara longipes BDJ]